MEESVVADGLAVAGAALEAQRGGGTLEALLEQNRATQEEELMVLEAIFAEDFARDDDADADAGADEAACAAYSLELAGETAAKAEARVRIRVRYVPEYPSHFPPECEVSLLAGATGDPNGDDVNDLNLAPEDAAAVATSLRAMFFEARAETAADGEPAEGIVSRWADWLREEWLGMQ